MDVQKIKQEAQGKWLGVFQQLGIEVPLPPGKHGPCPIEKAGTDRFRLNKNMDDLVWFCNQCTPQAGDGVALVQKVLGISFPEALKKVAGLIGHVEVDQNTPKPNGDPRKMLNKIWKESVPLTGSCIVSKYLHARKIMLQPADVRFCPKCYESSTMKERPAMVALIRNSEGKPVCLHRTYLDGDKKADIEKPKKMMPPVETLTGSAIRLFMPGELMFKPDVLGVAEGLESAMSAAQLFGIAVWSCMSTSILEKFEPPKEYKKIVIMSDSDSNYAGQKSAYTLANKLYNKDLLVYVKLPSKVGDFNDILMEG